MEAAAYKRLYPHEYYEKFISQGARPDGRPLGRARPVSVARGVVSTADGSALVKIGRTTALAAVKLEVVPPELDAPDEGGLDVTVELPPMCSAATRPGRPSEEAAYCSRRVADVLRDAKVVDPKRLCVDEGRWAWRARLDVYVLDHDGCVLDAAILAANGALRDCVVPVASVDERGEVAVGGGARGDGGARKRKKTNERDDEGVDGVDGDDVDSEAKKKTRAECVVTTRSTPLSLTTAIYRGRLIVDPTAEEEGLAGTTVTVCLDGDGAIVAVSKPGGDAEATESETARCVAAARARYETTSRALRDAFGEGGPS